MEEKRPSWRHRQSPQPASSTLPLTPFFSPDSSPLPPPPHPHPLICVRACVCPCVCARPTDDPPHPTRIFVRDFEENFSGKFSNSNHAKQLFTHTCGTLTCFPSSDTTGQWGMLKKNICDGPDCRRGIKNMVVGNPNRKMHLFYLTWTYGDIKGNYEKKLNTKYVSTCT